MGKLVIKGLSKNSKSEAEVQELESKLAAAQKKIKELEAKVAAFEKEKKAAEKAAKKAE